MTRALSFSYEIGGTGSTATPGTGNDYTGNTNSPQTYNIPAGLNDGDTFTIDITVLDDLLLEPTEIVNIQLTPISNQNNDRLALKYIS